jgi:folate-binding protein YgfZ
MRMPTPELGTIDSTVLRLEGRDALDLLHRISTNSLLDLEPGAARATLFCDFRGRLLHRAVVAHASDGAVWMLRDDAPPEPLAAYLDRHVFREDVRIANASDRWTVVVSENGPPPGALEERDGTPLCARPPSDLALRLVPRARSSPPDTMAQAAAERRRVRAGRVAHGHEIVEAFHPFEVNLGAEVHLDKGCFTGQETLMRLVTYRSVRRRLARVSGAGAPPPTPVDVKRDAETVGRLTTAVSDETGWIGLAVLGLDAAEGGSGLVVEGGGPLGEVVAFPIARPIGRP